MYKLLIPALALCAAVACGDANNQPKADNAQELRVDAAKAQADADQAAAEADAKSKAAAEATKDEWKEYQRETWNPTWDKFYVSTDPKYDDPDFTFERNKDGIVITRKGWDDHSRVEDAMLASAVNAQYVTDKDVKAHNVSVEVVDNVVHLRGQVSSQAEATEAVRLAINTKGVHSVVSHLTVAPK